MKFDCGLTAKERLAAREHWHRWFAWYPVRIGSRDCRWLETVERQKTRPHYLWEYREMPV